jgi:protein involved in polysaccharide export with SLBB domain
MAVARAGASTTQNPDLNRVSVTRTGPDGKASTQLVNLYPILKDGDLSHDIKLQKGDLVFVPQAAKHINLLDPAYLLRLFIP